MMECGKILLDPQAGVMMFGIILSGERSLNHANNKFS